jgi:hypothetical protein
VRLVTLGSIVLALALTGCVEPADGTPASADLAGFGVEPEIRVRLDEDGFSPDTLTPAANTTIAVTNEGDEHHGLLQLDTPPDRRIETGDLVPGETVDIHLAEPGPIDLMDPRSGATLVLEVGSVAPGR